VKIKEALQFKSKLLLTVAFGVIKEIPFVFFTPLIMLRSIVQGFTSAEIQAPPPPVILLSKT